MTFNEKQQRQIRLIRKYAKKLRVSQDKALQRWVDSGCAAKWGNKQKVEAA